jgi:hypothetical protein
LCAHLFSNVAHLDLSFTFLILIQLVTHAPNWVMLFLIADCCYCLAICPSGSADTYIFSNLSCNSRFNNPFGAGFMHCPQRRFPSPRLLPLIQIKPNQIAQFYIFFAAFSTFRDSLTYGLLHLAPSSP